MRSSILVAAIAVAHAGAQLAPIPHPRPQPKPYTMTQTTTFTQLFANGMVQTRTSKALSARDSERRTRREEERAPTPGYTEIRNGESHYIPGWEESASITVYDPIEKIAMTWETGTQSTHQVHLTHNGVGAFPTPKTSPAASKSDPSLTVTVRVEKLGQRAFPGVMAQGTRETVHYPAGFAGYSQEFTVVREYWIADGYDIGVESTTDDPRSGKSVTTLDSFSDQEPDPALFKPPAGYKIIETKTEIANPQEKN